MGEYIPSPAAWVADQVELIESSKGTKGTTLKDSGMPVILVTHRGRKTGATRKTPLMRAVDGKSYILVASMGGAPKHPVWYHNLKADLDVEIRDATEVFSMRVREISDPDEKHRLWDLAVAAYPPYQDYQDKTDRIIPVFIAEQSSNTFE
ncbi:MAG: nitroreductase family deazaflavin-dependent oxidoreductase [Chloroflexi bacterium]|nr:nitroreductase family deazaflavin-dependent oxidoreductase [Chloroflexota bacterium]